MKTAISADVAYQPNDSVGDVTLAARCAADTMLITARCVADVEHLARRIHAASDRAACPFVQVMAATLPVDAAALTETCTSLLDAAPGGSILLADVEQTPPIVQERLIDTLTSLKATRDRSCGVRLIAGTTTLLWERVADGTFSARLFYRLNIFHVVAPNVGGRNSARQRAPHRWPRT
jgi:DNA-binding NtrC family response regulator